MKSGPRVYNLFPLLVGSIDRWSAHLPRIADMGFDWVFVNPFHLPGASGSLYAVRDYYRLNASFDDGSGRGADSQIASFAAAAEARGLGVMMDLVVNHTAIDHPWTMEHADWYVRGPDGAVRSPFAVDPDDPRKITVWRDLAEIDYSLRPERDAVIAEWRRLVRHYASLGIRGFRCDAAYKVPASVWAAAAAAAREIRPDAVFAAETLGCRPHEVEALAGAGLDFLFNSSRWWDFRQGWLLDQYERYRRIAPSIAFPESHDTNRLAADLAAQGVTDAVAIEAAYRMRYLFAAVFSTGIMIPIGYEYGFRRSLHVVSTRPADWEEPRFDLGPFLAEVNALKAAMPVLNEEGPQERLVVGDGDTTVLVRRDSGFAACVVTAVNPDPGRSTTIDLHAIAEAVGTREELREITPGARPFKPESGSTASIPPFGARLFQTSTTRPASG